MHIISPHYKSSGVRSLMCHVKYLRSVCRVLRRRRKGWPPGGMRDLLWVMDLLIIVTVTILHRCVPMQRLTQLNSSVCAVHCQPGQYVKKKTKTLSTPAMLQKNWAGSIIPKPQHKHQTAVTVHLHTASQVRPARVLTHSILIKPWGGGV